MMRKSPVAVESSSPVPMPPSNVAPLAGDVSDDFPLPSAAPPETMRYPAGWYLFGRIGDLRRGPCARKLLDRDLVAFLTESGKAAVIGGRCVHMGADLSEGRVVEETLQCPLHHWRFGVDGRCSHVPACSAPPAFAKQASFPTAVRHGNVYFFNGPRALYPLPFFADIDPTELIAAPPYLEETPLPLVHGRRECSRCPTLLNRPRPQVTGLAGSLAPVTACASGDLSNGGGRR